MARAGLASTLPRDERGSALAEALETGALAGRGAVIDVLPRLITTGLTTGTTATLVPSLLRLYRWLL
ncbi:hypothetical protein FraEuI1c_5705 [Pseudofrankia inefficax]|uniref:Uncharacterized protein n=2 Tax=Pseudofrankia inefficax (strain DSM 45817 / CECT 9037 / DDB 130130 / EuI1c) TaxID=298654 RepID=E3IUK4_PSEI1|nr:hypothetical protein FraEuI1c_5705 [Pseudofrankia inefficax]